MSKEMHFARPFDLESLFHVAMNRELPPFQIGRPDLVKLNLGAGYKMIDGTKVLDLPQWDAETMPIPYEDESVGVIYAFGFLEHIKDVPRVMKECQRVLAPGGVMNIMVSYYSSNMAHEDPYHKTWFAEGTWKVLMQNEYWKASDFEWKLDVWLNVIMGVVERNMCLLTQLVKRA